MKPIDWAAAASSASSKFDADVQDAAGAITMGLDDLLVDPNLTRQVKLGVLQRMAAALADRTQLQRMLSGRAVGGPAAGPAALGGGSGDTDRDLEDRAERAEAQNAVLVPAAQALREVALHLGLSVPADLNTRFPADIVRQIKQAIADKETAAKALPAGMVPKTELDDAKAKLDDLKNQVKAKLAPIVTILTAARDSRANRNDAIISKIDRDKAMTATNEVATLVR